ncbi:exonuclease domain-containing protein [Priestia megaterium]|uniref:3'-5' exonuclease n=1 Tax=Priestia megaterium TaxID=1404 RepID=UPI001C236C46|nr:3'-5' exonuclease [Priestia megaterium]MBU8688239.1 exonuclease domain-containing protein [Priestia megaterium]
MADVKQLIFFDFEMLCSNKGMSFEDMEAIRLGAVKYNIKTEDIEFFDRYIQPTKRVSLSRFCTELTGIKDTDLVGASNFKNVFEDFLTWIGGIKKSRFFSWSTSDLSRLKIDAVKYEISLATIKKIEQRYVDFQAIFTKRVSKNNVSVENGLALYNLQFEGKKHNPMYDAYNTLRIYLSFLNEPVQSDFIMIKQFILEEVPQNIKEMNAVLRKAIQKDLHIFAEELNEMYKMKDAVKIIKRAQRIVKKYENILINRSGLFSEENSFYVGLLVDFYHNLLICYNEHLEYSSKIIILDESTLHPLNQLSLKRG